MYTKSFRVLEMVILINEYVSGVGNKSWVGNMSMPKSIIDGKTRGVRTWGMQWPVVAGSARSSPPSAAAPPLPGPIWP